MLAIILLLFLAACVLVAWAAYAAIAGQIPPWSRVFYLIALMSSVAGAYFTTFHYVYFANANTRFHGWPVPTVIFQREGPGEPWLDFIGPTAILAYPMNLVLFAFIPALIVLATCARRHRKHPRGASPLGTLDGSQATEPMAAESGNPYQPPLNG